jgi:hypothetical protein
MSNDALTQQTFLGASIRDFDVQLGWGTNVSTLRVNLVEDPKNNDKFEVVVGAPYRFQYDEWIFDGIVSNYDVEDSSAGKGLISVSVIDPRQILEGTQALIGGFSESVQGVPNLYNVFRYWESLLGFGGAGVNDVGMGWKLINDGLLRLTTETPINFHGYEYYLDFTALPDIDPSYRIGGSNVSILQYIQNICETGSKDFFIELNIVDDKNIIVVQTIDRSYEAKQGKITEYLSSPDVEVESKSMGFETRFSDTSKFLVGGKKEDIYFQFTSGSSTQTTSDDTIWPYWGLHQDGNLISSTYFYYKDNDPTEDYDASFGIYRMVLSTEGVPEFGAGYRTDEGELRAALAGIDAWQTYLLFYSSFPGKVKGNNPVDVGRYQSYLWHRNKVVTGKYNNYMNSDIISIMNAETLEGLMPKDVVNLQSNGISTINDITDALVNKQYNFVLNYAQEYYGKKFTVKIPFTLSTTQPETNNVVTSMIPIPAGFLSEEEIVNSVNRGLIPDNKNFILTEDNKIYAFVRFSGLNSNVFDVSYLSKDDYYTSGNYLYVRCQVDPKIVFLNKETGYSPRVVISLPAGVMENDPSFVSVGEVGRVLFSKIKQREVDGVNSWTINRKILTQPGMEIIYDGQFSSMKMPDMAAIPLQSNLARYGPWYNVGVAGGVDFEQNESFVPWNFGSYTTFNQSAQATVDLARINNLSNESGRVTVPGSPTKLLGRTLIDQGPYVTDIGVSVSNGGITTTYTMKTWEALLGKQMLQYHIARFNRLLKLQTDERRKFNELFNNRSGSLTGSIGSKLQSYGAKYRNLQSKKTRGNTSNHMIIGSIVKNPKGNETNANVVSSPFYDVMKYLDEDYTKKAGITQEGLFRPFSTNQNNGYLSTFRSPTVDSYEEGNDIPTLDDLNPYQDGHDFGAVIHGSGVTDLARRYFDPGVGTGGGHELRPIALRGPLIISGWGFDINEFPVPNKGSIGDVPTKEFLEDYLQRSHKWKTGAVDLKWDESRGLWVPGNEIITVRLTEDLLPGKTAKGYILARNNMKEIDPTDPNAFNPDLVDVIDIYNENLIFRDSFVRCIRNDNKSYYTLGSRGLTQLVTAYEDIFPNKDGEFTIREKEDIKIKASYSWMTKEVVPGEPSDKIQEGTECVIQYFPGQNFINNVNWVVISAACPKDGF